MGRGLSLANKCVAVFGGAVVLIVLAALIVPWFRMNTLVDEGQLEVSRRMAEVWDRLQPPAPPPDDDALLERAGILARRLSLQRADALADNDPFLRYALSRLRDSVTTSEAQDARWVGTSREYRYALARRSPDGQLSHLVILERRSIEATRLLLLNSGFLISAGGVILLFSLLAFYILMHRVILEPVRTLKETAELVREGNLAIRSDIHTGDEFEQLSETFNHMLADLQSKQDQVRGTLAALDLKISELASANSALNQASILKGEFLAKVSHELRTPLNSIIGFAELLLEIARADAADNSSPQAAKRIRYGENIVDAGRNLLAMINSLLDMAKIEAGKIEIDRRPVSLREACEGLLALGYPLAQKKGIQLKLELQDDLPVVETDPKKLQQILFNFLSNAVKFTPAPERTGREAIVTLRAESLPETGSSPATPRVRISVIDNGPGISPEDQAHIFEKFHQLDNSHTREHTGTGLGLAISKELASVLQGEIHLVSELGRGSMFSLILPTRIEEHDASQSAMEHRLRGVLAGRRDWDEPSAQRA